MTPGDISSLAYTVIPWLVGQAMIRNPMQASKPITLYQASDATLLAWDDPVVSENDIRYASAVHAIEPKLVLLRGRAEPYLQLRVKLSQVMPSLVGTKKHAWVKVGDQIVKAKLKTQPHEGDGKPRTSIRSKTYWDLWAFRLFHLFRKATSPSTATSGPSMPSLRPTH